MRALFIFCAGIIPVVPLIGMGLYAKKGDKLRKNVCIILFALQLILSAFYIYKWLGF